MSPGRWGQLPGGNGTGLMATTAMTHVVYACQHWNCAHAAAALERPGRCVMRHKAQG